MNSSILRLFNGVYAHQKDTSYDHLPYQKRMISHGYILDPCISPSQELLDEIESIIGISGEKMNQSFHKSYQELDSFLKLVNQQYH